MDDQRNIVIPETAEKIKVMANEKGFTMSCDNLTGNLLRTLVSAKSKARILELGTGAGYSTTWILEGMDDQSVLTTVEFDEQFASIAIESIQDPRVDFHVCDGGVFIEENRDKKFDIIFADTWPGKFYLLEEVLDMVQPNGIYIIDDLNQQPNWPDGHEAKVEALIEQLEQRKDFHLLKLDWSTGIIIMTKK